MYDQVENGPNMTHSVTNFQAAVLKLCSNVMHGMEQHTATSKQTSLAVFMAGMSQACPRQQKVWCARPEHKQVFVMT